MSLFSPCALCGELNNRVDRTSSAYRISWRPKSESRGLLFLPVGGDSLETFANFLGVAIKALFLQTLAQHLNDKIEELARCQYVMVSVTFHI